MKTILNVLFFWFLIVPVAEAYNHQRCNWAVLKPAYNKMRDIGVTTVAPTSTAEFTSSFGPCSGIGMVERKRVEYVAMTWHKLSNDIARGGGEYLASYAHLSGCSNLGKSLMPKVFKERSVQLIAPSRFEDFYNGMSNAIINNKSLLKECKLEV